MAVAKGVGDGDNGRNRAEGGCLPVRLFRCEWMPLSLILAGSLIVKLIVIFRYGNLLTLSSDDLGYYKSAVVLLRRGILTYHGFNDPTVFITPLYPLFLSTVFGIAGDGFAGLQTVRVLQVLMAVTVVLLVFNTGKLLCDRKTGLWAAFLTAFYFPNTVTAGYLLTETLFTLLLCLLVYCSLCYAETPSVRRFILLGILWGLASLCRPTIALFPLLYGIWLLLTRKGALKARIIALKRFIIPGLAMAAIFILVMSPWWLRNFREYGKFIPLSASTGNPTLQGTYINYQPEPGGYKLYGLGRNTYETNAIETGLALRRIREGFTHHFSEYLKWYTVGKTAFFWKAPFYWKSFLRIGPVPVFAFHYLALAAAICGFGILAVSRGVSGVLLPIFVILYFNAVHCVTMAFDRYAFPLMPFVFLFSAFFFARWTDRLKSGFLRA